MYLVWINPPINYTFSDDSVFLKKILAGDINSLNLLVLLKSGQSGFFSNKQNFKRIMSLWNILY